MPINPATIKKLLMNDPSSSEITIRPGGTVTYDDVKELVKAAKDNTYLKKLAMWDCDLNDDSVELIAASLTGLEHAVFETNNLTDVSAAALAKMPNLRIVILGCNKKITDVGAKLLAEANLTVVDLSMTKVTGKGAAYFLKNDTVVDLSLELNDIDPKILEAIKEHLSKNKERLDFMQQSTSSNSSSPRKRSFLDRAAQGANEDHNQSNGGNVSPYTTAAKKPR